MAQAAIIGPPAETNGELMLDVWRAPWTDEQIELLQSWQDSEVVHPYTCGNCDPPLRDEEPLVPTPQGWVCPHCDYTQDWALEIPELVPKRYSFFEDIEPDCGA